MLKVYISIILAVVLHFIYVVLGSDRLLYQMFFTSPPFDKFGAMNIFLGWILNGFGTGISIFFLRNRFSSRAFYLLTVFFLSLCFHFLGYACEFIYSSIFSDSY